MGAPQVFSDRVNDRLVFIDRAPNECFWDDRWSADEGAAAVRRKSAFVQRATTRYLSPPARVLDAGCGLANTVFGLHHAGFDAYGLDFAPETIARVGQFAPELNISLGDVRDMPFDDNFFDGVWSLGVIEHFYDGYEAIINEARRVIKPGKFLFLTVPSISPLRRLKIKAGAYGDVQSADLIDFYQFAFPVQSTAQAISAMGFKLMSVRPRGGYLGLTKESGPLSPMLERLHRSKNRAAIFTRRGLDVMLNRASFHTAFFVFVKQ